MTRPSSPGRGVPTFLAGGALALVLISLVGRVPLLFDAISAFLPQIVAVAAVIGLWALARRRIAAGLIALVAIAAAALGAPEALRSPLRDDPAGPSRALTLATANLFYGNDDLPGLIAALDDIAADVLVTIETPRALWDAPGALAARYPHRIFDAMPGRPWGVAVWSALPFADGAPPAKGGNPRHVIARLDLGDGGAPMRVMGLHMDWPVFGEQARILDDFDRFWRAFRPPGAVMIAGDFNAAPWSAAVARVAAVSGARVVDGLRMTWTGGVGGQAGRMFVPGGLPIDHVLLSPGVGVRGARTLALPGSDHRAVIVEARVPQAAPQTSGPTPMPGQGAPDGG